MTTQLETRPSSTPQMSDPETEMDEPIWAHIVRSDEKQSGEAKVMEARVMGTPVTAMCGHVWVPSRDPMKHPICQKCIQAMKELPDG